MNTVWLNDGEVNPSPGMYRATELDQDEFFGEVSKAYARGTLQCKIRSWSNVYLVNAKTKMELKPDIEPVEVNDGDTILAIFQKYPRSTINELCYYKIKKGESQ